MRRLVPLLPALGLLVVLTACTDSGSPTPEPSASPSAAVAADVCGTKSGSASESVDVSGDLGVAPTVKFDPGIDAKTTERTVLVAGTGDEVKEGASAEVAYSIYNGQTGALVGSGGYTDAPVTFAADATQVLPGLAKSIGCVRTGSRVVSVIPADDAWGPDGNAQSGVAAGASLVAVLDVMTVLPTRATGTDQAVPEGLPRVTLAKDGTPTVAIPSSDPPTDLKVATLKKGDGPVVPDTATVTLQYQLLDWKTGKVVEQTWGNAPTSFPLSGVVKGFAQAIAGQTVGSQVLAVIPPALGYGEADSGSTSQLAGETLVFVIDILASH